MIACFHFDTASFLVLSQYSFVFQDHFYWFSNFQLQLGIRPCRHINQPAAFFGRNLITDKTVSLDIFRIYIEGIGIYLPIADSVAIDIKMFGPSFIQMNIGCIFYYQRIKITSLP